jgi:hypothetical protein
MTHKAAGLPFRRSPLSLQWTIFFEFWWFKPGLGWDMAKLEQGTGAMHNFRSQVRIATIFFFGLIPMLLSL